MEEDTGQSRKDNIIFKLKFLILKFNNLVYIKSLFTRCALFSQKKKKVSV